MTRRIPFIALVTAAGVLGGAAAATAIVPGPPSISYSCSPGPVDCSGWHNYDVTVTWTVTNANNSTGCDVVTVSAEGENLPSCTASNNNAGFPQLTLTARVLIDKTAPTVTGAAFGRGPDQPGGWYTSPVNVAFAGTDAGSGLASCQTVGYSGPDTGAGAVNGTCTDLAGNVSAPFGVPIKYDSTPPEVSAITTSAGDANVTIAWATGDGVQTVRVIRTALRKGARAKVVYTGTGSRFRDTTVANGTRYTYEVLVIDAAGNVTRTLRRVKVGPTLLAPVRDRKGHGVTLRWTRVRGATYYNVQLFRNGKKLLSAWPTRARMHVPDAWRFGGHGRSLKAGVYRFYVWPGVGVRGDNRFGSLIGSGTFRVRTAS